MVPYVPASPHAKVNALIKAARDKHEEFKTVLLRSMRAKIRQAVEHILN
jgi:hypothetical protein